MVLSLKTSILSVLLILAIGLSAWSILISKHSQPKPSTSQKQPDAYMEEVIATVMNKQGNPSLRIASPKMIHYAENDSTYITKPHVTVYRQTPQPWYINSDYAQSAHGMEQITFSNNVVIHHLSDAANPATVMKTTSLTVFPNKQEAATPEAITIVQPDITIHAIGMLANLEYGTVKLLAKAKGEYAPTS